MKDRTKNTPQVLLRRALLVLLDAAIVAFSFYFALLLRADGAVEAGWWPHNRALLYENLPWIVAVYIVCFLAGGLYSVLWKYAGERDLIRLAGMIAVPTAVVYVVNRRFIHGVLFNSANCMASVLIFLFIGGNGLQRALDRHAVDGLVQLCGVIVHRHHGVAVFLVGFAHIDGPCTGFACTYDHHRAVGVLAGSAAQLFAHGVDQLVRLALAERGVIERASSI